MYTDYTLTFHIHTRRRLLVTGLFTLILEIRWILHSDWRS
jgi:hypothetical protein